MTLVLVSELCVSWQLDYHFFHPAWQQSLLIPHPSICHLRDEIHIQCVEAILVEQKSLLFRNKMNYNPDHVSDVTLLIYFWDFTAFMGVIQQKEDNLWQLTLSIILGLGIKKYWNYHLGFVTNLVYMMFLSSFYELKNEGTIIQ